MLHHWVTSQNMLDNTAMITKKCKNISGKLQHCTCSQSFKCSEFTEAPDAKRSWLCCYTNIVLRVRCRLQQQLCVINYNRQHLLQISNNNHSNSLSTYEMLTSSSHNISSTITCNSEKSRSNCDKNAKFA